MAASPLDAPRGGTPITMTGAVLTVAEPVATPVDRDQRVHRPDDPRRQHQRRRQRRRRRRERGSGRLGPRAGRDGPLARHSGERSRRHLHQHDHDDADAGRLTRFHDDRSLQADRAAQRDLCGPRRRARHAGGGGDPPQVRALARHEGPVPALRRATGPDRQRRRAPAQPQRQAPDRPPAGPRPRHRAHRWHRVRVRPPARDRRVAEASAPRRRPSGPRHADHPLHRSRADERRARPALRRDRRDRPRRAAPRRGPRRPGRRRAALRHPDRAARALPPARQSRPQRRRAPARVRRRCKRQPPRSRSAQHRPPAHPRDEGRPASRRAGRPQALSPQGEAVGVHPADDDPLSDRLARDAEARHVPRDRDRHAEGRPRRSASTRP